MSRGRFIWLPPMVGLLISGCATGGTAQTPPHPGGPSAGVGVSGGKSGVGVSSGVQVAPSHDPVLDFLLKGAAIGAIGGPIGLGAGAVAGLVYGLFEKDRIEKRAQSEMTRQAKIDNELERQIETKQNAAAQHGTGAGSGLILVEDHLAPAQVPSKTATAAPSKSGEGLVVKDRLASPGTSTAAPPAPATRSSPTVTATGEGRGNVVESRQQIDERIAAARERQRKLLEALQGSSPPTETTTVAASPGPESRTAVDPEGFRPVYEGGRLVRKERDVNGDGKPDILRYYNGTGRLTRQEEDSRLGGRVDTWTFYEGGRAVRKESDTDGDGKVDLWAFYDGSGDQDRLVRTEADTDHDGRRDRVTLYAKGEVTQEQHYSPGLDVPRAVITYTGGKPARNEEDTDGDGRMDRLTEYDGSGRVTKVSQNPVKAGSYTHVAYHQPQTGEILREEEDLNGDGGIDIISYYQQGRLVRREFFDLPEVAALRPQLSAPPMPLPQEAP
ncbi:MAG TPA: VCBS repeat-containing protein [Candidatus Methylomirabilis sp.]|nr:VCBS repeat-containing protein [Candidatus Methylomirabilis sp.]